MINEKAPYYKAENTGPYNKVLYCWCVSVRYEVTAEKAFLKDLTEKHCVRRRNTEVRKFP